MDDGCSVECESYSLLNLRLERIGCEDGDVDVLPRWKCHGETKGRSHVMYDIPRNNPNIELTFRPPIANRDPNVPSNEVLVNDFFPFGRRNPKTPVPK